MSKYFGRLAAVAATLTLAACRDVSPVAPTGADVPVAASLDEAADLGVVKNEYPVVTRTTPLARYYWTQEWVYPSRNKYQSVKIREAGLSVSFPPGAVDEPLLVTLVAHPGKYIVYDFYPHGTKFNVPVKIQQDLHGTSAYMNAAVMSDLLGGYMDDGIADLDQVTGLADLTETFTIYYWDDTDVFKKTTPSLAKFYTNHFSGYVLASGRTRVY